MDEEKKENIEVEIEDSSEEVENKEEQNPSEDEKSKEKQYYERLLYLTAEFDNYKKRVRKEKADYVKFSTERLIKEIIPVLDNFERALEKGTNSDDMKSFIDGIRLIYNQLVGVLKKEGVKSVESLGKKFDPLIHEAISHVPSSEYEPNSIIAEQARAYFLSNKLIRPATVVVSKGKDETGQSEDKNESGSEESNPETDNTENNPEEIVEEK